MCSDWTGESGCDGISDGVDKSAKKVLRSDISKWVGLNE